MALFRLAETLRVADPRDIERKLPPALIAEWFQYFAQKEKRFDKLEYYLVQLSYLIAGFGGKVDVKALTWDRGGGKDTKNDRITAAEAEKLLRAAFGV